MKRIVRLTERDLSRIIRRVIKEDAMGGFVSPCQAELDALNAVLPDLKSKMPPTVELQVAPLIVPSFPFPVKSVQVDPDPG